MKKKLFMFNVLITTLTIMALMTTPTTGRLTDAEEKNCAPPLPLPLRLFIHDEAIKIFDGLLGGFRARGNLIDWRLHLG